MCDGFVFAIETVFVSYRISQSLYPASFGGGDDDNDDNDDDHDHVMMIVAAATTTTIHFPSDGSNTTSLSLADLPMLCG